MHHKEQGIRLRLSLGSGVREDTVRRDSAAPVQLGAGCRRPGCRTRAQDAAATRAAAAAGQRSFPAAAPNPSGHTEHTGSSSISNATGTVMERMICIREESKYGDI